MYTLRPTSRCMYICILSMCLDLPFLSTSISIFEDALSTKLSIMSQNSSAPPSDLIAEIREPISASLIRPTVGKFDKSLMKLSGKFSSLFNLLVVPL